VSHLTQRTLGVTLKKKLSVEPNQRSYLPKSVIYYCGDKILECACEGDSLAEVVLFDLGKEIVYG